MTFITKIILFLNVLFLISTPVYAYAEGETGLTKPKLQIEIPTLNLSDWTKENSGDWLAIYIAAIFKYAVGIIGIVAAVVMMYGGLVWLTAGGDSGRVSEAKEWIKASLYGLTLALFSYTILYTVNPDLVKFRSLVIRPIEETQDTQNQSGQDSYENNIPDNLKTGGKLRHNLAKQRLSGFNIGLSNNTSLEGVRETTIEGIIEFRKALKGGMVITSGTDGSHNPGKLSHSEGYKLDLRTRDNQNLVDFVKTTGTKIKDVAGYPAYAMETANYNFRILEEPDHFDVRITPKNP